MHTKFLIESKPHESEESSAAANRMANEFSDGPKKFCYESSTRALTSCFVGNTSVKFLWNVEIVGELTFFVAFCRYIYTSKKLFHRFGPKTVFWNTLFDSCTCQIVRRWFFTWAVFSAKLFSEDHHQCFANDKPAHVRKSPRSSDAVEWLGLCIFSFCGKPIATPRKINWKAIK